MKTGDKVQVSPDLTGLDDWLAGIEWFRKSVRDIRAFKVEDWSDFTDIIKNEK
ncbi:hypothetical protein [uncultured Parabacteroides sp.]|jgi:virulence-associated protein VapD|uniref:hypothetical protein n=1 Tax=uncultured Parabacteroides sp. TaxID=512312 RepID=UPI0025F045EE|nr:hypothetical protein [uncultured Parabacteroides sp.]